MLRPLLTLALLTTPLALAGCDEALLTAAAGAALGADTPNAKKVRVTGTIYAPAAQVAVVAAGGMNWRVAARSDEKGVPNCKVSFASIGGLVPTSASVQADGSGRFTIEVPEQKDYTVTATFEAKAGGSVTLTGLCKVGSSAPAFELDAAHNLVASRLVSSGLGAIDAGKLATALSQMHDDLSKVSSVPTPTSRSAAATTFDSTASAETKATVAGMK